MIAKGIPTVLVCLVLTLLSGCSHGSGTRPAAGREPKEVPRWAGIPEWEGHFLVDFKGSQLMRDWGETRVDGLGDKLLVHTASHYVVVSVDQSAKKLRKIGDFSGVVEGIPPEGTMYFQCQGTGPISAILAGDGIVESEYGTAQFRTTLGLRKFTYDGREVALRAGPVPKLSKNVLEGSVLGELSRLGKDRVIMSNGSSVYVWDANLNPVNSIPIPSPPGGHKWMGNVWGEGTGDALYFWSRAAGRSQRYSRLGQVYPENFIPYDYYISRYDLAGRRFTATAKVNNGVETEQHNYEEDDWNNYKISMIQAHNFLFPDGRTFYQLDAQPVMQDMAWSALSLPIVTRFSLDGQEPLDFNPYEIMVHMGLHAPHPGNIALVGSETVMLFYTKEETGSWAMTHNFHVCRLEFDSPADEFRPIWDGDKLEEIGVLKMPLPKGYDDPSRGWTVD